MIVLSEMSDGALLERILSGDEEAFTILYRRREGRLYRFALHMSGSSEIAEEVTQEVFMVLMREGCRYDFQRGSVASYLFGVARNYVLRCLERDRPYVSLPDEPGSEQQWVSAEDTLADLTRTETIESVRLAVLSLPEIYREAVVLCDLHEMSYAEAAGILGCALGTVRSRLHRGRGLLLEKLTNVRKALV